MFNTIKALSNKDLLALYNVLTGKDTSKFSSREKGESQTIGAAKVAGKEEVLKLLAGLGVEVEEPKKPEGPHDASNRLIHQFVESGGLPEVVVEPAAPAKTKKVATPKAKAVTPRKGTNLAAPGHAPLPCREGSKQAILLDALRQGATMEELIAALSGGNKPWTEATVRSGFGWDMKQKGYGVCSSFDPVEGSDQTVERFHLVVPAGFEVPAHTPLKGNSKKTGHQLADVE